MEKRPMPLHLFFAIGYIFILLLNNKLHSQNAGMDRSNILKTRAIQLLNNSPLIDGHNDFPEKIRAFTKNHLDKIDISKSTQELKTDVPFQTDLPRLRKGRVGGVFFSAYVPIDLGSAAVSYLFEQIDMIRRIAANYTDDFALAYSASDVEHIHRTGKIAILIGIENGEAINNSLAVLRQAFNCGARYLTLTHVKTTDWADASDWEAFYTNQAKHGGLSPFGHEVIREMNRLGMMVDLSHVSDSTAIDALNTSVAPVIFSHSCSRAVCNHQRNVPDEILKLLKNNNGVIMLNFQSYFISEEARIAYLPTDLEWKRLSNLYPNDPKRAEKEYYDWASKQTFPEATINQLADHIDHIRKVAGIDHIGIGSDFDGAEITPVGLEDVSNFPALFEELLKRNYTSADIEKIAGKNILRVMKSVEKIAADLKRQRQSSDRLFSDLNNP